MKSLFFLICLLPLLAFSATTNADAWTPSPRERNYDWMSLEQWYAMHEEDKDLANKGEVKLLFLGDSITQGWDWEIWQQHFGSYKAGNFGIGGDKTQNVLWRLQNGGVGKLDLHLIVLMIGVNNFGHDNDSAEDVVRGTEAILDEVAKRFPSSKALILGILPYGEKQEAANRERVAKANTLLKKLSGKRGLVYRDYGSLFINSQGDIPKELMGDLLHPTKKGYALLAEKLAPLIKELMDTPELTVITDKKIIVEGRSQLNADNSMQIGYPGVSLHFNFNGGKLSLVASSSNGNNLLDVFIDGKLTQTLTLAQTPSEYFLLDQDKKKSHQVELVHRSETWHGIIKLAGLNLYDGKLLTPPTLPKRKLLIVGDSVTCGEALLREPVCKKEFSWWNPEHSYGKLLGEKLNAQAHLVCFGGRGLIRSWNGRTDEQNAPLFFNASIATGLQSPRWDHNQYTPDMVLIALGTNDFSLGIGSLPTESEYVPAYVKFIQDIQAVHPKASIVLTDGPLVNDLADPTRPQKAVLQGYLKQAQKQSTGKVFVVPSEIHDGDACDAHPTAAQHAIMAEELAPQLKQIMHW